MENNESPFDSTTPTPHIEDLHALVCSLYGPPARYDHSRRMFHLPRPRHSESPRLLREIDVLQLWHFLRDNGLMPHLPEPDVVEALRRWELNENQYVAGPAVGHPEVLAQRVTDKCPRMWSPTELADFIASQQPPADAKYVQTLPLARRMDKRIQKLEDQEAWNWKTAQERRIDYMARTNARFARHSAVLTALAGATAALAAAVLFLAAHILNT